jgi:cytochrome c oxidase subunit 2
MLIASAVIFGVVLVLLLVAVLRRRGPDGPPLSSRRGDLWIPAVGGIAIPIVVLAGLFALTLRTLPKTSPASASATGLTIEVVGRQWFWDVSYPGKDVRTALLERGIDARRARRAVRYGRWRRLAEPL